MVRNADLLLDFLNCVLRHWHFTPMVAIEILNPEISDADLQAKQIVLDVRAKDQKGRHYNIEMQTQQHPAYVNRMLYYAAQLYVKQLQSADHYEKLRPIFAIHLLNHRLRGFQKHPESQHLFHFRRSDPPHEVLTDLWSLMVFELKKLSSNQPEPLGEWLWFFANGEEETEMSFTHEPVKKAMHVLQELSADEKEQQRMIDRERALLDANTERAYLHYLRTRARKKAIKEGRQIGVEEGRQIGVEQGKAEGRLIVAKNLLAAGFTPEKVAELLELPLEQVQSLQNPPSPGEPHEPAP